MGYKCCSIHKLNNQNHNIKSKQKKTLLLVLFINIVVFLFEIIGGSISHSESIIADSLHLFSHIFIITLSLFVLTQQNIWKTRAAFLKAVIVFLLGISIVLEASTSLFVKDHLPEAHIMSIVSIIAFLGNIITLFLLQKHRSEDLNMRSTLVCSQADFLTNIGLILTGCSVAFFNIGWPDSLLGLCIGLSIVFSAMTLIKETYYKII